MPYFEIDSPFHFSVHSMIKFPCRFHGFAMPTCNKLRESECGRRGRGLAQNQMMVLIGCINLHVRVKIPKTADVI